MSPQLHWTMYGFHQHDWLQVLRGTGYRPVACMHHGLMVGLWMAAASLLALGLWMGGAARRVWGVPAGAVAAVLVATTLLCKSLGSILLIAGSPCGLAPLGASDARRRPAAAPARPVPTGAEAR